MAWIGRLILFYLLNYFILVAGTTLANAQGLSLVLCSGVTSGGGAQETTFM